MNKKPLRLQASHLGTALFDPTGLIVDARVCLRGKKFDTLIGTGLSGALVLPLLARALRKNFAVVRKPDNAHSDERVEGAIGSRWIFVDDLVSTGATFQRVHHEVRQITRSRRHVTEFAGAYLYNRPHFHDPDPFRREYL